MSFPQTFAQIGGAFVVVSRAVLIVATEGSVVFGLIDKVISIVPVAVKKELFDQFSCL